METENVASCAALPPNGVQREESRLGCVKQPMIDSQPLPLFSPPPHITVDSSPKRSYNERASSAQPEEGVGIPADQSEPMSGDGGGYACRQKFSEEGAAADAAEEEGRGGGLPPFKAAESTRSQTGSPCRDRDSPRVIVITTCEQSQQQREPSRLTVPTLSFPLPLPHSTSSRLSLPSLPPLSPLSPLSPPPSLRPPSPLSSASSKVGIAVGSLERPCERRQREREPRSLQAGNANAAGIGGGIAPMMIPIPMASNLPSLPQNLFLNGVRRKWQSDINKREHDFCQLLEALQQEMVSAIAEKDGESSRHLAEKASRLVSARKRVIEIADGRGWSCAELFERYTMAEFTGNEEEKRRIVSEEEFAKRSSRGLSGRRRGGERKRTAIARPPTAKRSKVI